MSKVKQKEQLSIWWSHFTTTFIAQGSSFTTIGGELAGETSRRHAHHGQELQLKLYQRNCPSLLFFRKQDQTSVFVGSPSQKLLDAHVERWPEKKKDNHPGNPGRFLWNEGSWVSHHTVGYFLHATVWRGKAMTDWQWSLDALAFFYE